MEENTESEDQAMLQNHYLESPKIDPPRARFPYCIVWTPLPLISWLMPFIGHMGICREDGVILDFAGPNFVSVDNFAFGSVARYIQINKEKECFPYEPLSKLEMEEGQIGKIGWDEALKMSTQEYQHHSYSLFTCNCHSYVANCLNRLGYQTGGWNVVNVAWLIVRTSQWVGVGSMARSLLPFFLVFSVGFLFGGSKFIAFLALFASTLVGWFVFATYFVKDVIHI